MSKEFDDAVDALTRAQRKEARALVALIAAKDAYVSADEAYSAACADTIVSRRSAEDVVRSVLDGAAKA